VKEVRGRGRNLDLGEITCSTKPRVLGAKPNVLYGAKAQRSSRDQMRGKPLQSPERTPILGMDENFGSPEGLQVPGYRLSSVI
jgi:hypothetical protein